MKAWSAVALFGLFTAGAGPARAVDVPEERGQPPKPFGIGGDLQLHAPVGDLADATGPQIGPLVRFGYRILPPLELTARAGYLLGLSKTHTTSVGNVGTSADFSVSTIPIWVGARLFMVDPRAGLYAAAELGLNLLMVERSVGGFDDTTTRTRAGFNVGLGYVISEALPIDLRAHYSMLNLLGQETGETTMMAVGLSAGYTYAF